MTAPPLERDRVIYLDLKRRRKAERASRIMDLTAALTLLFTAVPVISKSPGTIGFAYLEAVAAAGLLISVVREMKKKNNAHHSIVGRTEIFSAVILMMDSVRKFESGPRHYPLAAAFAALSVFILVKGYLHTRIAQSRRFRFHDEGITGRQGWFNKFSVSWKDVTGITATLNGVNFALRDGRITRLDLTRIHNAREVSDEVVARAVSKGIGIRAASVNDCVLPAT
ncbi:MAG: hypothetical protein ABI875_04745 [Gemmatimonadales bacterium]